MIISFLFGIETAYCYQESPSLAVFTAEKKLPPVDQRLPARPIVVPSLEEVGHYTKIWRTANSGNSEDLVGLRRILYEPLVRWDISGELMPNIAWSWKVSNSGRQFLFNLVKGLKWSDGDDFTADDVIFAIRDILLNKELTPSVPRWLSPTGVPPRITKVDQYTVQIDYEDPYSILPQQLACIHGQILVTSPLHYLKKFHASYANKKDLDALIKSTKAKSWVDLFRKYQTDDLYGDILNIQMPVLTPWKVTFIDSKKKYILDRNPYYGKVDAEGKQLPYFDRVEYSLYPDDKSVRDQLLKGLIDGAFGRLGALDEVETFKKQYSDKFRFIPRIQGSSGVLLAPNINHPDKYLKNLFENRTLRVAVSLAINRERINSKVFNGKGQPRQAAPLETSPFYRKSFAEAFIQYDPEKSQILFDRIGLKRGVDGVRRREDGAPLRLEISVMQDVKVWATIADLIAEDLQKTGLNVVVKRFEKQKFRDITRKALHHFAIWAGPEDASIVLDPRYYLPTYLDSLQAPLYGHWYYTRGREGEEPPAIIKGMLQNYNEILTASTTERRKVFLDRILDSNEHNLWTIGILGIPADYYITRKDFRNLPARDFAGFIYPNPGPIHPEQFYIK